MYWSSKQKDLSDLNGVHDSNKYLSNKYLLNKTTKINRCPKQNKLIVYYLRSPHFLFYYEHREICKPSDFSSKIIEKIYEDWSIFDILEASIICKNSWVEKCAIRATLARKSNLNYVERHRQTWLRSKGMGIRINGEPKAIEKNIN